MRTVEVQGVEVPSLGLGTWQLKGAECERSVAHGLEIGYRHIDTAQDYGNEEQVGKALEASSVDRGDVFLTTKLGNRAHSPGDVHRSAEESLRRLRTDYLDLFLIHWPVEMEEIDATLTAMSQLQDDEKVRYLGLSNFTPTQVRHCLDLAPILCNQVEYHPYLSQERLLDLAARRDLIIIAYSPLARGRILGDETLREIGETHDATPAQVTLRWLIQQDGVAAIPRSTSPEHLQENLGALEFELSDEDMKRISGLAREERVVDPPFSPAWER